MTTPKPIPRITKKIDNGPEKRTKTIPRNIEIMKSREKMRLEMRTTHSQGPSVRP